MKPCDRRQTENRGGAEQHRCIHNKSEFHLQIVDEDKCSGCPVRVGPPVSELPVVQEGFEYCGFRDGLTCTANGHQVTPEICSRCIGEAAAEEPGLGQRAINYTNALRRWVANGRPVRSQEEIDRIFEEHCKGCEMFDGKMCKSCGCNVGQGDFPLNNKLAMKTEVCPMGRWA